MNVNRKNRRMYNNRTEQQWIIYINKWPNVNEEWIPMKQENIPQTHDNEQQ